MFKEHTTAEGKKMLIISMSDDHLKNTISLKLARPMDVLFKKINVKSGGGSTKYLTESQKYKFREIQALTPQQIEDEKRNLLNSNTFYIYEALRRELTRDWMIDVLSKCGYDEFTEQARINTGESQEALNLLIGREEDSDAYDQDIYLNYHDQD